MRAKTKKMRFSGMVKWIIFATNIVAMALLFCSFLSWKVSPLKTNLFSYIGLGFGFVLFTNVAYFLFWVIFSKWKLALISVFAIILCYQPVTTYFPLHPFATEAPEKSVKLLTYNVQGFPNERKKSSFHPILDYISTSNADIVCLQEYLVSKTGQTILSQKDVERLLKKYPYHSVTGLESSGKYHIYGLACFSKYPIEKTHEVVFESSYNGAAVYTIKINEKSYTVANVHLESNSISEEDKKLYSSFLQNADSVGLETVASNIRIRLGKAYRARAKQVTKVKAYIAKQNTDGVIICGDFNDTPISYAYYHMRDGLKDAYVATGFGPGITYHEDFFLFRIDHIMHSNNIKAFQTQRDKVKFSDHYPLTTRLMLY